MVFSPIISKRLMEVEALIVVFGLGSGGAVLGPPGPEDPGYLGAEAGSSPLATPEPHGGETPRMPNEFCNVL